MVVKSLKINNLRNIKTADIEPGPALNLIHGANGAGKTSILEALVVLAKGRSFRSGQLSALIGPETEQFRIVVDVTGVDDRVHRLGIERARQDWRGRIDEGDVSQLSEFSAYLPIVLVHPESHDLVSGPPEGRRRYLDWSVFHVKHAFLDQWRRYSRALDQRNAALRSGDVNMVRTLDPQVVTLGNALDEARRSALGRLEGALVAVLETLSAGVSQVEIAYQPGWRDVGLAEALNERLETDLERGWTSVGPHRADLLFRLQGRVARERLSRGEEKVLASALLLAQAHQLHESGITPVLLMDDLASEFDREHLERVIDATLALGVQVFITGTSLEPFSAPRRRDARVFHVKHGSVSVE